MTGTTEKLRTIYRGENLSGHGELSAADVTKIIAATNE